MLRRKRMPAELQPAWELFLSQAERVEKARQALLSCLPVGRVDPAPVPVGLDLLAEELAAMRDAMEGWRRPEVEPRWLACRDSLTEALEAVEPARDTAERTAELEELLDAVTDVIEPLDAWAEAERTWLRLRVRPPRVV